MKRPFIVRVQDDDPDAARQLASDLRQELATRNAPATVEASSRGRDGTSASIGVLDAGADPRWLAPVELPRGEAKGALVQFLERWGFIPAARRAAP